MTKETKSNETTKETPKETTPAVETPKESYGIEKLKIMLMFMFAVYAAWRKAMKDGKLNWADLGHAMNPATKLIPAIGAAPGSLKEISDLTTYEKDELMKWARDAFDIEDKVLEEKIELGLNIMFNIAVFVGAVIPKKK